MRILKLCILLGALSILGSCKDDQKLEPVDVNARLNLPSAKDVEELKQGTASLRAKEAELKETLEGVAQAEEKMAGIVALNRSHSFALSARTSSERPEKYQFAGQFFSTLDFQFAEEITIEHKNLALKEFIDNSFSYFPISLQDLDGDETIDQKFIDQNFINSYDDDLSIAAFSVTMDVIGPYQDEETAISFFDILGEASIGELGDSELISQNKDKIEYLIQVKHNSHVMFLLKILGGEDESDDFSWEADTTTIGKLEDLKRLNDSMVAAIKTVNFLMDNNKTVLKYKDRYKKLAEMTLDPEEEEGELRRKEIVQLKKHIENLLKLVK